MNVCTISCRACPLDTLLKSTLSGEHPPCPMTLSYLQDLLSNVTILSKNGSILGGIGRCGEWQDKRNLRNLDGIMDGIRYLSLVPTKSYNALFSGQVHISNDSRGYVTIIVQGNPLCTYQAGEDLMYVPSWRRFEQAETIAVVYGMIDALAISELGYPVVTVTAGKEQFKPEWIWDAREELEQGKCKIVIIPDFKEEATAKELERQLDPYAKVIQLPYVDDGMRDPADYLVAGKEQLLHRRLAGIF